MSTIKKKKEHNSQKNTKLLTKQYTFYCLCFLMKHLFFLFLYSKQNIKKMRLLIE